MHTRKSRRPILFHRFWVRWLLTVILGGGVIGAGLWRGMEGVAPQAEIVLHGETMGTTFTVRVRRDEMDPTSIPSVSSNPSGDVLKTSIQQSITKRLGELNGVFSTWDSQSELSQINQTSTLGPVILSNELAYVLSKALFWGEHTGGALDVTVGPLVKLWGFGPQSQGEKLSDMEFEAALAEARERVGIKYLLLKGNVLVRARPGMEIDLSAIAKGYGVDQLGILVHQWGGRNFLVEIGGEVVTRGVSPDGTPWLVGVDLPQAESLPGSQVAEVIALREGALATSGSYRRFRKTPQQNTHHLLDPRTGRSTASNLVSVTVFAKDCMTADALATALMVMGVDAGLPWVAQLSGFEALFLVAQPDGSFQRHLTEGFKTLLVQ